MNAFIAPPPHIPIYLRFGIWIAEKMAKRELLPPKLLAWYPKVAVSSGVLEALIAHREGRLDERMLQLVRLQASFAVACPFCIDMNSVEYARCGITREELSALQGQVELESIATFSARERVALEYTRLISRAPLAFPQPFIQTLKANFNEREIVILATTAAQVNYWARLIQALGVPPVGYSDQCPIP
jgi:alkylhydroperoxidase family enzyme